MSTQSTIEWTDATWITLTGCEAVSPGCTNCYAEGMSCRQAGMARAEMARDKDPGRRRYYLDVIEDGGWSGKVNMVIEALADPLIWAKPQMIFVNSMSDTFHKSVHDDYVRLMTWVMGRANWHTYQVLTKRSSRMRNFLQANPDAASLPNVWWGVSVEDKAHGLPRVEHLRQSPAAVRFLSVEPLLEDVGEMDLAGIDWAIVGGESGVRARPMQEEWALSVRDQCQRSRVAFFFKQWGGRNKKETGRMLQGQTYDEMPPVGSRPVAGKAQRLAWIEELEAKLQEFLRSGRDDLRGDFKQTP